MKCQDRERAGHFAREPKLRAKRRTRAQTEMRVSCGRRTSSLPCDGLAMRQQCSNFVRLDQRRKMRRACDDGEPSLRNAVGERLHDLGTGRLAVSLGSNQVGGDAQLAKTVGNMEARQRST